jgi:hypothetical protein
MKKVVFIVLVLVLMLAAALPAFAGAGGACPPGGPGNGFDLVLVEPYLPHPQDHNGNGYVCRAGWRTNIILQIVTIDDALPAP